MTTLHGVVKNRRVEMDVPEDWAEGTSVEIFPITESSNGESDEVSPEEIARTLAAMDKLEAIEMTDEELAAWEADREARKALQKLSSTSVSKPCGECGNETLGPIPPILASE